MMEFENEMYAIGWEMLVPSVFILIPNVKTNTITSRRARKKCIKGPF